MFALTPHIHQLARLYPSVHTGVSRDQQAGWRGTYTTENPMSNRSTHAAETWTLFSTVHAYATSVGGSSSIIIFMLCSRSCARPRHQPCTSPHTPCTYLADDLAALCRLECREDIVRPPPAKHAPAHVTCRIHMEWRRMQTGRLAGTDPPKAAAQARSRTCCTDAVPQ